MICVKFYFFYYSVRMGSETGNSGEVVSVYIKIVPQHTCKRCQIKVVQLILSV